MKPEIYRAQASVGYTMLNVERAMAAALRLGDMSGHAHWEAQLRDLRMAQAALNRVTKRTDERAGQ